MKQNLENSIKQSLENFELPYNAEAWAKMSAKLDATSPVSGAEAAATGAAVGAAAGSIESVMKESLNNFEAPYNPEAWTALESKLDAQPTAAPTNTMKWFIAAASVVAVLVAGYYYVNREATSIADETNTPSTAQQTEQQQEDVNNTTTNAQPSGNNNTVSAESNSTNENGNPSVNTPIDGVAGNDNTHDSGTDPVNPVNTQDPTDHNNHVAGTDPVQSGNADGSNTETPHQSPSKLVINAVNDVCQGDVVTVKNINDEALLVSGADLTFIVPAHQTRNIRMKSAGNFTVSALESKNESVVSFIVKDAPAVDFMIDDFTKYEGGIPTTKLESTVPGSNYTWVYDGNKLSGKTAEAHFYTQGNHDVSLTVTGGNGCSQTLTKSIYIDKTYNLMAENAFRPNDTDPKVNTFMPYALKQRDVEFTMIIIDRDGHTVYQTNDATQGWNGIDMQTGRMVSFEKAYIWKVTIESRATNEKRNEYTGQITPVSTNK